MGRRIVIVGLVGVLATLIVTQNGFSQDRERPLPEELRQIVMATWGGGTHPRRPLFRMCWNPREVSSPLIRLRPRIDGTVEVAGGDPKRVGAMRQIQEEPSVFLPVIEDMISDALASRSLWELYHLEYCLLSIPRIPAAQVAAARLYLGLHTLVTRDLPRELLKSNDPEAWADRCGLRLPRAWAESANWRKEFLDRYESLEVGILGSLLIPLKFRSNRVWQAQIETLRNLPPWVELLPEEKKTAGLVGEGAESRCPGRVGAALRYLVWVYRDDKRTGDTLAALCKNPDSAIAVFDGCEEELARAVLSVSK